MAYRIEITETALEALSAITDHRIQAAIRRRIEAPMEGPQTQGKVLRGELACFLSIRAAAQRYRVIYRVDEEAERVRVYLVGIRKEGSRQDIYALAQQLVRRGLL